MDLIESRNMSHSHESNNHDHREGHANPSAAEGLRALHSRLGTADLFEMASLDALGLLDEQERRAFEDGFAAAPASVKEQIRATQTRFTEIDAFLPKVNAPSALRGKVIAAVQAAIDALPGRRHEAGRATPTFLKSRGVSPIWRAVAIGCAAAVAFFSVATVSMLNNSREMEAAVHTSAMFDSFKERFGTRFRSALMAETTQFVKFKAPGGLPTGAQALLLMDEAKKTGMFFCFDLPSQSGQYALVVVQADGSISEPIATFRASGGTNPDVDIPKITVPAGGHLALTPAGDSDHSKVILSSDAL